MQTSGDTNVKVAARCRPFNGELQILFQTVLGTNFILLLSLSDLATLVT